jgi:integrase
MSNSSTRFRFNKTSLAKLEPTEKRYQVYDTLCPGLILRVTETGLKVFYRQGRVNGQSRRIKIGPFPTLSVDKARDICQEMNGNIVTGNAPNSNRGGLTFGDLWTSYWSEHATVKKAKSSQDHDEWQWKKFLKSRWATRKAVDIAKADVVELQTKIAKNNGKVTANRVLSLVKKMYNHAIDKERLKDNPADRVKKYREHSRKRFLQGDELPRFFKALDNFDNPDVADFWRVCLFTGARQANVLEMRWREIDFSSAVWTIPKTKRQESQRVPLVAQVVELLENRRNLSEYVFSSHGKTGHLTRPGKAWERLLESADLEDLTMHDLRRSLGSYQAAAGVSEFLIGQTLGHAPGSKATAAYTHVNLDPVRAAVEKATAAIVAIAKPAEAEGGDE